MHTAERNRGIISYDIYDFVKLSEDSIRTRGNRYKLNQCHCYYDLRKYNYTNRAIPIWNSLSDYVGFAEKG